MTVTSSSFTGRVAALLGILAVGLGATEPAHAATALAPLPPAQPLPSGKWVADLDAGTYLSNTAWAYLNQISEADCAGTGRTRHLPVSDAHHTFRCTVTLADGSKAKVQATALGPEWLRVTKVASGLKPDRGVGPVPKGPHLWDDGAAQDGLEKSSWAARHHVDASFCAGIGDYTAEPDTYLYGAFSCSTLVGPSTGPQVIIRVLNHHSAEVVRTITR